MDTAAGPRRTMRQKLEHEMTEFAVVALYLFVCFAALMAYKAAVTQGGPIGAAPFAFAALKAAILGKFVLIGDAARVGERLHTQRLITRILLKSGAVLVLLAVLSALETILVGLIHHRGLAASVAEIDASGWRQIIAGCVVL